MQTTKQTQPRWNLEDCPMRAGKIRCKRFKCNHCGVEGWYDPTATHIVDPRTDHDRADGRKCRKAEDK
jgi:hypothetical protein